MVGGGRGTLIISIVPSYTCPEYYFSLFYFYFETAKLRNSSAFGRCETVAAASGIDL